VLISYPAAAANPQNKRGNRTRGGKRCRSLLYDRILKTEYDWIEGGISKLFHEGGRRGGLGDGRGGVKGMRVGAEKGRRGDSGRWGGETKGIGSGKEKRGGTGAVT